MPNCYPLFAAAADSQRRSEGICLNGQPSFCELALDLPMLKLVQYLNACRLTSGDRPLPGVVARVISPCTGPWAGRDSPPKDVK